MGWHYWRYERGGKWEKIPTEAAENYGAFLEGLGFYSCPDFSLGTEEIGLSAHVHEERHVGEGKAEFLVDLRGTDWARQVLCPTLPDMLDLLHSLSPVIESARVTAEAQDLQFHCTSHGKHHEDGCRWCVERRERNL